MVIMVISEGGSHLLNDLVLIYIEYCYNLQSNQYIT